MTVHPVAPLADDEGADGLPAVRDAHDMADQDVVRVIRDHHLAADLARISGHRKRKLAACGDTGGERDAKHQRLPHGNHG